MKILLVKKSLALLCLLLAEFCSSEEFNIFRYQTNPDAFFIPLSKCYTKNKDTLNYCAEYNATRVQERGCFCDCDHEHATFSFQKPSWSCRRNEDTRALFGCKTPTFFQGETKNDKLRVLGNGSDNELSLRKNCAINAASSWYIDCDGGKVPLRNALIESMFELEEDPNVYNFEVFNLQTNSPLIGKLVNLGISCGSSNENYCLLFKLIGNTRCPLSTSPMTTGAKVEEKVVETYPPVDGGSTDPTQALAPPTPAADRKSKVTTVSLGLIVGVTVAFLLIVLLVGTLIHRQLNARKHPRTISEGQGSQSDLESQSREQSDGYETLSTYRSSIYAASKYDVPNSGPKEQTVHLRPPCATSNAAGQENQGQDKEEPFYNTVDELFSNNSERNEEYVDPVASERPAKFGPFSVEQRVYNMIEELNTGTSESTYDYGTNKGYHEHVPLSVEQPEYNLIEALDAKNQEDPDNSDPKQKDVPVYNVLEEHFSSSVGYIDGNESSSVKDPVYNVLEEPDPDTTIIQ